MQAGDSFTLEPRRNEWPPRDSTTRGSMNQDDAYIPRTRTAECHEMGNVAERPSWGSSAQVAVRTYRKLFATTRTRDGPRWVWRSTLGRTRGAQRLSPRGLGPPLDSAHRSKRTVAGEGCDQSLLCSKRRELPEPGTRHTLLLWHAFGPEREDVSRGIAEPSMKCAPRATKG